MFAAAVASSTQRRDKGKTETFVDADAMPFHQKEGLMTDQMASDSVWSAITPVFIDVAYDARRVNIYSSGDSADVIQKMLDDRVVDAGFPDADALNDAKKFDWKAYKPRVIPKKVLEASIGEFIARSTLWDDSGYYVIRHRVTHANVSAADDYLMTIQLILHKEGTVYAKVIEYDVLYIASTFKCLFARAKVIGVVHEQYLGKPVSALVSGY